MAKKELTYKYLKSMIEITGLKMVYDKECSVVKYTHDDPETICEINQWLLDYFPHYMTNIDYGVKDGKGWLQICCIDR